MNEKATTYHDCHNFKWQNINIYQNLVIFLYNLTPLLARWIVITPNNNNTKQLATTNNNNTRQWTIASSNNAK
jgi:hypothetical protein